MINIVVFKFLNIKILFKIILTGGIELDSRSEDIDLSLYLDLICFFLTISIPSKASSNVLSEKHYIINKSKIINLYIST